MNRHPGQLPIWRDASALLLEIEQAVRGFPRYHKYTVGTDLRRQSMDVCRAIVRAAGAERREHALDRLVLAVEDLKLTVQLVKELKAYASFAEFARIAELAVAVGKQSGGWRRSAKARARPEARSEPERDPG